MKIPIQRLDPALSVPEQAHEGDAGVDLRAREGVTILSGEWAIVPTGVAVAIPEGYVGLVSPRSGLAARHGVGLANSPGVVDSGYRGELHAVVINHGPDAVKLERGDRIAQLVVVPAIAQEFVEVEELPPSARGGEGFGSTGSK